MFLRILILSFVLFASVACIRYQDLKKSLLTVLASRATAFIGQEVAIGDLSIGPGGVINLSFISIRNPVGFRDGNLLTIRKLSLNPRYREILKKQFSFESIVLDEPEFSLIQNKAGEVNISRKLKEFFQRESTLKYRIDAFIVRSGTGNFNNDRRFRNDNVNISIRNISSVPGIKTSLRAQTVFSGSRIDIDGWIFLKDGPKRMNLTLSSPDFSFAPLREMIRKYGGEITDARMSFLLKAEGDLGKGFTVTSNVGLRNAKFGFLKRDAAEIRLTLQAFLSIPERKILVDDVSLNAGSISALSGKGEVRKVGGDIQYWGEVNVRALDLSAFSVIKDAEVRGIVTSERLRMTGSARKIMPQLSGFLHLREAEIRTADMNIVGLDAVVRFHSIQKSQVDLRFRNLTYGGYSLPAVRANSRITYRNNVVRCDALNVTSPDVTASSHHAEIRLPRNIRNDAVRIDFQGLDISHRNHGAETTNAAITVTVGRTGDSFQGTADFSADTVTLRGITSSFVKGSAHFDEKAFSVDISQAGIFGGRMTIALGGQTSRDVLPLTIVSSSENIDLAALSRDILPHAGRSYPVSGFITSMFFKGTINSIESVEGVASIQAENLAIADGKRKLDLVKEGIVKADIAFRGKDLDIRGGAGFGKISLNVSGSVQDFGQMHRAGKVKISMPQISVADMRESLWEVFPDSLLYAGIEGDLISDIVVHFDDSSIRVDGNVVLNDIILRGENGEYEVGPVKGIMPVAYQKRIDRMDATRGHDTSEGSGDIQDSVPLPSFDRNEFRDLSAYYAEKTVDDTFNLISVGRVTYGFEILDDVKIWIRPEGKSLHFGRFSGNIFGGRLNGSATIELAQPVQYRAGFLIEGVSLTQLCDRIEPIRGYVSGKLDGIAMIKGYGSGLSALIGKADFWTYSSPEEKTKISKEFLHRVGGLSLKRYLGDRKFDRGVMNLYLQNGYVIFRELEISNRNFFGLKDLDIKVAPLSNRISLDHLLWSITEATYRAKKD